MDSIVPIPLQKGDKDRLKKKLADYALLLKI